MCADERLSISSSAFQILFDTWKLFFSSFLVLNLSSIFPLQILSHLLSIFEEPHTLQESWLRLPYIDGSSHKPSSFPEWFGNADGKNDLIGRICLRWIE